MKMGLLTVERVNAITLKRIALIDEFERRKRQKAHPRVGVVRHQYNIEKLKTEIDLLEKKRMLIIEKGRF